MSKHRLASNCSLLQENHKVKCSEVEIYHVPQTGTYAELGRLQPQLIIKGLKLNIFSGIAWKTLY